MAPILAGIDLGQSHLRVGASVLNKYIVAQGTKDIKVNSLRAPSGGEVAEVFEDADRAVKSSFGGASFHGAVVVVPNSTSSGNREAVSGGARAAGLEIIGVINEHTAVAAAFAEKVKPNSDKRLAIVSVTGGVLDISIILVKTDLEFVLEAQETQLEPIEVEEERKHAGLSGGLIGLVGGVVGGAVKTLVVDPLDFLFDILKKLLSSPKLSRSPVDEVVFVGKASKSEKLKEAVKEKFPNARVWSPEDIGAEEVAAYGAVVIAYKQKPAEKTTEIPPPEKTVEKPPPEKTTEESESGKGDVDAVEEEKDQSSKKFVPISSVIR